MARLQAVPPIATDSMRLQLVGLLPTAAGVLRSPLDEQAAERLLARSIAAPAGLAMTASS
jgi:hypothetical protein